MIIRDTPSDIDKFFMADGELAFLLQQRGITPAFMDFETLYFRKTKKLEKILMKLGIDNGNT